MQEGIIPNHKPSSDIEKPVLSIESLVKKYGRISAIPQDELAQAGFKRNEDGSLHNINFEEVVQDPLIEKYKNKPFGVVSFSFVNKDSLSYSATYEKLDSARTKLHISFDNEKIRNYFLDKNKFRLSFFLDSINELLPDYPSQAKTLADKLASDLLSPEINLSDIYRITSCTSVDDTEPECRLELKSIVENIEKERGLLSDPDTINNRLSNEVIEEENDSLGSVFPGALLIDKLGLSSEDLYGDSGGYTGVKTLPLFKKLCCLYVNNSLVQIMPGGEARADIFTKRISNCTDLNGINIVIAELTRLVKSVPGTNKELKILGGITEFTNAPKMLSEYINKNIDSFVSAITTKRKSKGAETWTLDGNYNKEIDINPGATSGDCTEDTERPFSKPDIPMFNVKVYDSSGKHAGNVYLLETDNGGSDKVWYLDAIQIPRVLDWDSFILSMIDTIAQEAKKKKVRFIVVNKDIAHISNFDYISKAILKIAKGDKEISINEDQFIALLKKSFVQGGLDKLVVWEDPDYAI